MAFSFLLLLSYIPFWIWVYDEINEQNKENQTYRKKLHRS